LTLADRRIAAQIVTFAGTIVLRSSPPSPPLEKNNVRTTDCSAMAVTPPTLFEGRAVDVFVGGRALVASSASIAIYAFAPLKLPSIANVQVVG